MFAVRSTLQLQDVGCILKGTTFCGGRRFFRWPWKLRLCALSIYISLFFCCCPSARTSHPSPPSMCVWAFDVCRRSTNCMRDILASTSTRNSVVGERMTTAHFLSLSSTTHFRSSNIEICLYLLLFCGRRNLQHLWLSSQGHATTTITHHISTQSM